MNTSGLIKPYHFLVLLLIAVLAAAYPAHMLINHAPDETHRKAKSGHEQERVCSICIIYAAAEIPSNLNCTVERFVIFSDVMVSACYFPGPTQTVIPRAPPSILNVLFN